MPSEVRQDCSASIQRANSSNGTTRSPGRARQRNAWPHDGQRSAHAIAAQRRHSLRDERPPPHREVQQVPALCAVGLRHDAVDFGRVEQIGFGAEASQLVLRERCNATLEQLADRHAESLLRPVDQIRRE